MEACKIRTLHAPIRQKRSLLRQGSVRLALKFAQALPQTVTVVAYAEFENVTEIDRDRNVVFDFGGDRTVPATAPGGL